MINKLGKYLLQILAFIAAIITILGFIYRNKTDLNFSVITNTNVFDINAEVSKLKILYDSVSLKENNYMLSILSIRLSNDGFNNIKMDHFDSNFPIGIQLFNGKIIEPPELVDASSNYLFNAFKITAYNDSIITFSPVLFDRNERVSIRILILHKLDQTPVLNSVGKLSGQSEIKIITYDIKDGEKEDVTRVLRGNIWMQIIRLLIYPLILVLAIAIPAGIIRIIKVFWSEYKVKRLKKETVRNFSMEYNVIQDEDYNMIFNEYLEGDDTRDFFRMVYYLKNDQELNKLSDIYFSDLKKGIESSGSYPLNKLIKKGYCLLEGDKIIKSEPLVGKVITFSEFVSAKGFYIQERTHGPHDKIYGGKYV